METAKQEKATVQTELTGKCRKLEDKLEQATQEKDKAYKHQMERI